ELGQALAGATDEHPRRLAPTVPLHAAAPRVRRAPADPRSGERERVGDVGAVDAANKDRVIGRDRIQGAAVDGERRRPGLVAAVRAAGGDPVAAERDRARFRPSRVDSPDATAAEDEVGWPGRVQPMRRRALRPARYRLASTSARTRPSSTQPEFSLMMSAPECAITQVIARATIAPTAS